MGRETRNEEEETLRKCVSLTLDGFNKLKNEQNHDRREPPSPPHSSIISLLSILISALLVLLRLSVCILSNNHFLFVYVLFIMNR